MDIATNTARYTTTLQIPVKLRQEIKESGMSIHGALVAGWAAIQERKHWNAEINRVEANMDKYRSKMMEYRMELHKMGKKVE